MRKAVLVMLCAALALAAACGGDDTPADGPAAAFESVTVADGLEAPTNFAFAPDGRIFVAEQRGVVRVIEDGASLPDPLIDIQDRVNADEQRGLLGLAVDPAFASNGYLYLYYPYEHDPSDPGGPKTNQLLRVTIEGDAVVPGSEEVILGTVTATASQPSCDDFPIGADCLPADRNIHIGGDLRFSPDGTLFVTTGDSAEVDEQRVRAQDLDSLAGKVLRINADGSAPADNPFFTGDPESNRSKVWAYGLREPFRFALQPGTGLAGTGLPFVGDVGSLYTEEISIARAGANLGWPCYEGLERPYAIGDHPVCDDLVQSGAEATTLPIYTYPTKPFAAIVAGDFPSAYPAPYAGAFFFADYARSWIAYLTVDADGNVLDSEELSIDADGPVALRTGPDGEIYFLSLNSGELRRLRWTGS